MAESWCWELISEEDINDSDRPCSLLTLVRPGPALHNGELKNWVSFRDWDDQWLYEDYWQGRVWGTKHITIFPPGRRVVWWEQEELSCCVGMLTGCYVLVLGDGPGGPHTAGICVRMIVNVNNLTPEAPPADQLGVTRRELTKKEGRRWTLQDKLHYTFLSSYQPFSCLRIRGSSEQRNSNISIQLISSASVCRLLLSYLTGLIFIPFPYLE